MQLITANKYRQDNFLAQGGLVYKPNVQLEISVQLRAATSLIIHFFSLSLNASATYQIDKNTRNQKRKT